MPKHPAFVKPKTKPTPPEGVVRLPGMRPAPNGLPILKTRLKAAEKALIRILSGFSEDMILNIAYEVGLDECISYAEDGESFDYDFTDLQLVAFTAAIAAVKELRDSVDLD